MELRDKKKRNLSKDSIKSDLKKYISSLFKEFKKDEKKGFQFMHLVMISIGVMFLMFVAYNYTCGGGGT